MSQLSDKITSYVHERGIELNQAYTLTPTRTGTATNGTYTLTNTAPVYESAVGPLGGAGSWRFRIGNSTSQSSLIRSQTGNAEFAGFADGLFTVGFWFRYASLPTGTLTNNLFETGSSINRIQIGHTNNATSPSRLTFTFTGSVVTLGPTIEANRWYFVAVRRFANTTNNIEVYLDGSLLSTLSQPTIQAATQLTLGTVGPATSETTFNMSNYFHGSPSIFTATAISEIWTAGSTAPNNLKYWNGTAWAVPINKYQWDGTNWVTMNGKYWNGTSWAAIT
jgi:hypothetical protein